jgi:hypothetical protein
VCRERCIETEGRANREYRDDLRDERRERREERREERRDRPGIEFRTPGVDVEIGR